MSSYTADDDSGIDTHVCDCHYCHSEGMATQHADCRYYTQPDEDTQ